jgi:hypothetical protein
MKKHEKINETLIERTSGDGKTNFEHGKLNGLNKSSDLVSPVISRTGLHCTFLRPIALSNWLTINALSPKQARHNFR